MVTRFFTILKSSLPNPCASRRLRHMILRGVFLVSPVHATLNNIMGALRENTHRRLSKVDKADDLSIINYEVPQSTR